MDSGQVDLHADEFVLGSSVVPTPRITDVMLIRLIGGIFCSITNSLLYVFFD